MVKHIVFFKLSDSQSPENKKAELNKMEQIFSPLGRKFSFIIEYRTGINFSKVSHAWDFAIDSVFSNKEDLQKYQDSEDHKEAIRKGSEIKKSRAVIDYEF
jgi:sugar/nucleoside kinase (ribokinase family)